MTLHVVAPAPVEDVVLLYDGALKPPLAKAAILQAARSHAIGFYEDEAIVAAALLYPRAPDLLELVFACRPRAGRHLTAIVHTARLTRSALAHHAPLTVRATVRAGHEPGRRLARLCGLHRVRETGGFEHWECAWVTSSKASPPSSPAARRNNPTPDR